MGRMGGFLRSRNSLRPRLVSAGRSHKQRNVVNAIPRRERGEVQAELVGIWEQHTKQEGWVRGRCLCFRSGEATPMKGRSYPALTASFGDDFGQFGGIFLSCQMIWTDLACLLSLLTCFLSIFTHKSIWHQQTLEKNKRTLLNLSTITFHYVNHR